jgi:hypothetical protein
MIGVPFECRLKGRLGFFGIARGIGPRETVMGIRLPDIELDGLLKCLGSQREVAFFEG